MVSPGGNRERETPVPIPNTEVKPLIANGTARVTVWESRSLPGLEIIHNKKAMENHGFFISILPLFLFPLGSGNLIFETLCMDFINNFAVLIIIPGDLFHRTALGDGFQFLCNRYAGHFEIFHPRGAFDL